MKKFLLGGAMFCLSLVTANATVIATFSNTGGQTENVLLNAGTSGTTVQGTFNPVNPFLVNFTSSQVLSEPSNGQARIEASTGGLGGLTISLTNGFAYQTLIFNAHVGGQVGGTGSGTITVVSAEPGGAPNKTFIFPTTLGNGENFVTLTASGGEAILSTAFSAPNTVTDIRQVRLSGFSQPTQQEAPGVPEPATMLMMSAGLVGVGVIRRRVKQA